MAEFLRDYQRDAVNRMKNGCILNGGVGSGKSRTGLYYYFKEQGGFISSVLGWHDMENPKDLYIITTAKKRNDLEWERELAGFHLSKDKNNIVIDSWNNIKKYKDVENAFFIFDEDKVQGYGVWTKSFLKIAKHNEWIILSATPGDQWLDYMPVFIANGYYKNKTDFINSHVEYDRYVKFPKIKCYHETGKLMRYRKKILVDMDFKRETQRHNIDIYCNYDKFAYKDLFKTRWNYEKNEPIANVSELCYQARKIINSDYSRIDHILELMQLKGRVIIFYNFDYELEKLRQAFIEMEIPYAECNGHLHQDIPDTECWAYLVQYNAGAEGWNCTKTDTIVFYSQNYSYKIMEQASGRIDRMNTLYKDLYYYHLKSRSPIDASISRALYKKKKFNESKFIDSLDLRFEN